MTVDYFEIREVMALSVPAPGHSLLPGAARPAP